MNDIPVSSGLYFESRDTGMWWAIYRYSPSDWAWWEDEVGCFNIEEINKCNNQEMFEKWKRIANANSGYKKAADFKDPFEIAELVKSKD